MAFEPSNIPLQGKLVNQKLLKSELQVEELINSIRICESDKSEVTARHFAARKAILGIKNDLQVLNEIKEQEDKAEIKEEIESIITRHKKTLMALQMELRKANLIAEERLSSSQRNELITNDVLNENEPGGRTSLRRRGANKDKALNVTSTITSDLIKIAEMMSTQVEHSIESANHLEESSKQLTETHEEYKSMTGFIQMSKKLINKYMRRETTDTLLIFFGLILFFSTVVYIVLKRI
eukprot:gene4856-5493_t